MGTSAWFEANPCGDSGLELRDLWRDKVFGARTQRRRDPQVQRLAVERLAYTLVLQPAQTMQAFADAAVALCEADGAGVSLSRFAPNGTQTHTWGATSGIYAHALRAMLPSTMAACCLHLEQGAPQHYRSLSAALPAAQGEMSAVTDGVLIPWAEEDLHGILWITAHGRPEAFDVLDARHMEVLGSFVAIYLAAGRDDGPAASHGLATAGALSLNGAQLAELIAELLDLRLRPAPVLRAGVLPFRA